MGLIEWLQKQWRSAKRLIKLYQKDLPDKMASIKGLLVIALILTLIVGYESYSYNIKLANGIVESDIIAPKDFTIVDEEATQRVREQATLHVLPIFEYDPRVSKESISYLDQEIAKMEQEFLEAMKERFGKVEPESSIAYKNFVKKFLTSPQNSTLIKDEKFISLLAEHQFDPDIRRAIVDSFAKVVSGYIYTSGEEATNRRIIIRNRESGEQGELRSKTVYSLLEAQNRLQEELNSITILNSQERSHVFNFLKSLITANLHYSELLTVAARKDSEEKIVPVLIEYRKNQIIARYGEKVTPALLNILSYLGRQESQQQRIAKLVALFLIIVAVVFTLRRSVDRYILRQKLGANRAFSVFAFTLILQVLLMRAGNEFCQHLLAKFGVDSSYVQYQFIIPYAGVTLIMALLLDVVSAQISALFVALLVGLITNADLGLVLYSALSGIAAAHAVEKYRQRNSITYAGIVIGLVSGVATFAVLAINGQSATVEAHIYNLIYGVASGLLAAGFASLVIPVNESLFDIITDVKLLELSNMKLPLLRDLALQAPGTYQHSIFVSSLAESAAEAIKANSLLVRVGCYYHDIGKMMAPEMFIENQRGRENPHDKMEPKRSASVITGHVKKGMIMAQEAGLPTQIIDFIPQHHGTRRLHYFYNKALEQYSKTCEPINEDHYRYPGPKPQSREAAIIMLSDCAEASVRSLDDPNPENIRTIIKRITEDVIADGQLEECELTMREFNEVREALIQTLISVYHHRIKYPGFNQHSVEETEGGLVEQEVAKEEVVQNKKIPAAIMFNKKQKAKTAR
ncbi:MAG: HDIG domain-containing protein [Blastocatellia bacterium]|nr:HDIG domain-containing protein [Blastocatellia bacterium]